MTVRGGATFVQRAWVGSKINAWYASTEPALMLTGPPGSGKSTLVGRLAGMGVRPAAVHLCRRSVVQSTEPLPALASFAAALAGAVPGYAEAVIRRQPSAWRSAAAKANADAATQARLAVLDSADAYAAYEHAFRDPLSALAAAGELGRGVVVVIDGLDEAGPRGNELTDLISAAVRRPIPCFRLLMTTRPGPIADRLPAAPSLDLADDPSTVDTIASALESTSLGRGTRLTIAKAAQGNFVYALLAAHSRDVTKRPPAGLDALYRLVLDQEDAVDDELLDVICKARDSGLSPAKLAAILQLERRAVDTTVTERRRVLLGSRLIRPHHRCLADHIDNSTHAAHGRIGTYLVDQWGGRWEKCADTYALRNVLPHLADAALTERAPGASSSGGMAAARLRETLADPAYLTVALNTIGVDELRAALAYTRHRIAGTTADVDTLPALMSMLHAEAGTLRECPSGPVATRQLLYLAATLGIPELARSLAGRGEHRGVETLWATDDNSVTRPAPRAIRGHRATVTALAVAANGTQAVSAALDGTTLVWRIASGRLTKSLPMPTPVTVIQSAPDAELVRAAHPDGTAHEWDLTTGADRRISDAPVVEVTAFAVANNGGRAVTGDVDYAVSVWDLSTLEPLLRLPRQNGVVTAVAISADGRYVAAACATGDVTVWDVEGEQMRMRFCAEQFVTALCLAPRGDRVVIGDADSATVHTVTDRTNDGPAESDATDTVVGRLSTRATVTALAANPAMPCDILLGTAYGQVAYIRVP